MALDKPQRRLAAILAADVAGYSRLMGEDEEGTLATLTAHLKGLIEPCIAEHRGRVSPSSPALWMPSNARSRFRRGWRNATWTSLMTAVSISALASTWAT